MKHKERTSNLALALLLGVVLACLGCASVHQSVCVFGARAEGR